MDHYSYEWVELQVLPLGAQNKKEHQIMGTINVGLAVIDHIQQVGIPTAVSLGYYNFILKPAEVNTSMLVFKCYVHTYLVPTVEITSNVIHPT